MNEIRILLDELAFTNLCKSGYITRNLSEGRTDIGFTKTDIISLSKGEILSKTVGVTNVLVALKDIGLELIKEIVKRSPIFSDTQFEN